MSKILHSFTLYERASAVLRKKSKKNQMSDNVSNAILWYYAQPKWEWIYKYDKDLDMDVQTDKKQLYRGYFDDEKKQITLDLERGEIAPYQRRHLQRTIGLLNCQIDELRAENEALKNNRFKFWKKFP
ncbi:MAG: hypothetical protein [Circular genetic element sp.]|nr:MAG: hypothetical protein [Circular genetic element sp.]